MMRAADPSEIGKAPYKPEGSHSPSGDLYSTINEAKEAACQCFLVFRRMPGRVGPKGPTNSWPEFVPEYPREIRRGAPSAVELSAAEHFSDLVASELNEDERKEVWTWVMCKTARNASLRGYCDRLGFKEHTYRRKIDSIFGKLAISAISPSEENQCSGPEKHKLYWRTADARPTLPDDASNVRTIMQRFRQ